MATLVDRQIINLANGGLITPFNKNQVNPASYDVRLDGSLLVEVCSKEDHDPRDLKCGCRWAKVNCADEPYTLSPGEFVLACTEEVISVPPYIEAVFQLKSSRGREGFEHVLSAYIDPGFSGKLTLELLNVNRYHDLYLQQGMLIGQIRFNRLGATPDRDYSQTGHYQKDMGVQFSKVDIFGIEHEEH